MTKVIAMKVLIIGAGRMGVRHLQGALSLEDVSEVTIVDLNAEALNRALEETGHNPRVRPVTMDSFRPSAHDVAIIATTAGGRKDLLRLASDCGCSHILIEKPLGQSLEEVEDLVAFAGTLPAKTVVNLTRRQSEPVIKLKKDLASMPQMQGPKTITLNTGSIGIGCNGIHFIDTMFFLLDADDFAIESAEIEPVRIPSGRGKDFCDFGGWAVIKFYREGKYLGRLLASMTSESTVLGDFEIVGPHGRIQIDERARTRTDLLRKADSTMPLHRYAADYGDACKEDYIFRSLQDSTADWLRSIKNGDDRLADLRESLKAHRLMFEWLGHNREGLKKFPIT